MNLDDNRSIEDMITPENVSRETLEVNEPVESNGIEINFDFIKRRTGEGDLDEYQNHMMNPTKSEGVAHILRGLTGFVGTDLRFAVLDIMIGLFKMSKGKKKVENAEA